MTGRALLRRAAICLLLVTAGPGPALAQSPGELRVALPWTPENLDPTMKDAYLLGLGGPMQDGDELYNLVSSKGRGLYSKNEKVDALFDAGRSTMDSAKRKKIYADLAHAMVEDAAWVFLMQQVDIYARDRVTWTPRGDQWMLLHEATLQ